MIRINYEASDYERIEDVKALVNSVSTLFDKFYSDFNNRYEPLQKAEKDIEDKKKEIETYSSTVRDCDLKIDELERLRDKTKGDIDSLSLKKKEISYTDSEVQKMEEEDIDSEINSKTEKIAKIETKILNTQEKRDTNTLSREEAEKQLDELTLYKRNQEIYIKKTEDILDLINNTKENFEEGLAKILDDSSSSEASEPVITNEDNNYPGLDFDLKQIELDYNMEDVELPNESVAQPTVEIPPIIEENPTKEQSSDLEGPIEMDLTEEDLNEPAVPDGLELSVEDLSEGTKEPSLREIFLKEGINYEEFTSDTQALLEKNAKRVKENIAVLKKHNIPLELTINQSKVYYKKDAKELDELLNIITSDEDGNGMGFTIDFVYYCLDEIAEVNIDKLINVYNSEFMKVDAKTGLIELLKKANDQLGEFENNRTANKEILVDLGVTTVPAIETTYPEFLALDNPLFLNALNLFDKEDLVEKLNDEIKIVPKILSYWRSN